MIAGTAFAAPAVDANIELDNTSREGTAVAAADRGLTQSGRVELNISNKAGADMFVAGRASFLSKKDGTVATDDMWIQLGSAGGDVKLGRFEAADLFPLAGDTLVNHAGTVYGANSLRGRKGADVFHAAGTLQLGSGFAFELGAVQTNTTTLVTSGARGWRPVVSYASGPLAVKLGMESGEYNSGNKVSGFGLTASYDFGSFKLTGNVAQGKQDAAANETTKSYALSAAVVGGLGLGYASGINDLTGGDIRVNTTYVSYKMPLFGIDGASVTPAFSSSRAQNSVANTSVDETAFRVRLNYTF
ncbi:MAG: hypothetical protein A3F78_05220 [Burkholderiales bacterium RIFCSPLOWO2_12_FULL_61_40]|nr:MAG: hypothetical protein A3F78_05220 [Burkholderiales bacterium RIFCSPLOWO2_12_FULL_61_40]